jgi:hypothetical protein
MTHLALINNMEVVGTVASVGGVIALAGQTLSGLSKLYIFFKAYKDVLPNARAAIEELSALETLLQEAQSMASKAVSPLQGTSGVTDALYTGISRCQTATHAIETGLTALMDKSSGKFAKKAKAAARRDYFAEIYRKLSTEKENLGLVLNLAAWQVYYHFALEYE